jgi:predicted GTPase
MYSITILLSDSVKLVYMKNNVIIMGAAGRDFHNFNTFFRNNSAYNVVAFTATQIPGISGRTYPKELAGRLYKKGIPIYPEEDLEKLIKKYRINQVVFSYSDVTHEYVMHKASLVAAAGADFVLLGPTSTMITPKIPLISVCAVRTGSGKSQTTRKIAELLLAAGKKVVVIRHPMPYGDLKNQAVQRFASYSDLKTHNVTIEEREEYEPHIEKGIIVYAGVDYEKILRKAEKEADIILWDGGNNDFSFYKSDLYITVADPHRAGHELKYHPGETNMRLADVVLVNKVDSANRKDIETVLKNIKSVNTKAKIIKARSIVTVDKPEMIKRKRVLIVEDGPTLTHGGMPFGAGTIAAKRYNCRVVSAKKYIKGSIKKVYEKYTHLDKELPAMGYDDKQIQDLKATINSVKCDVVLDATPVNLSKLIKINKPIVNVTYEAGPDAERILKTLLNKFIRR